MQSYPMAMLEFLSLQYQCLPLYLYKGDTSTMSTCTPTTMFLFEMLVLQVDPTGYRISDRSNAIPVSVVESTLELAREKCIAMLGKANTGMIWSTRTQSVKEVY